MKKSRLLPFVVAAVLGSAAGCSLRNDPHYNRYAPQHDQLRLTHRADQAMNAAEHGLDNARQRIENIID
jgi:hypothetical protein